MRASTLVRLAVSGTRTDSVRLLLTAFGSALATLGWLCAATVAALGFAGSDLGSAADDNRYTSALLREPGLRPGVVTAFVLLTIPVLAFVGQCARLGAPARDRRIAAMRLAGATPRQAVAIGAGESGASALLGSALGVASYFVLRRVLDNVNAHGQRTLPTDVLPSLWVIVVVAVALPVVVALASAWLLRAVTTSPLGVVRRGPRRRPPRVWPGILILIGLLTFAGFAPLVRFLSHHRIAIPASLTLTIFYVGVLMTVLGVVVGAGWIAYATGCVLRRASRRAAGQLAAARLIADPWQGSRAFGVLMVAAVFGGGTAVIYQHFVSMTATTEAQNRLVATLMHQPYEASPPDSFYTNATLLVAIAVLLAAVIGALGQLVAISEAIVSRRRAYAGLVAAGVPRSVLARAQLWQSLAVAVPALTLATTAGLLIGRFVTGTSVHAGAGSIQTGDGPVIKIPDVVGAVPVPWANLGLVVGVSVGAVALTVAIGLLFLKASTSVDELRTA